MTPTPHPNLARGYLTLLAEVALVAAAIGGVYALHPVLLLAFGVSERLMLLLVLESTAVIAAVAGAAAWCKRRWTHLEGFTAVRLSRAVWLVLVSTMATAVLTGTGGALFRAQGARWFLCVGLIASGLWSAHPLTRRAWTFGVFGFLLLLLASSK